jgi:hypothetical protein
MRSFHGASLRDFVFFGKGIRLATERDRLVAFAPQDLFCGLIRLHPGNPR